MKNILLGICVFTSVGVMAQPTRTTVQNGTALNPFTWDCTCVPSPGDNIVINHALTLDVDFGYNSGSLTVNSSGSITGSTASRFIAVMGGAFTNNGSVSIGNMYHSAGTFYNYGTLTVGNLMGIDQLAVNYNYGTFTVNDSLGIDTTATLHNYGILSAPYTLNAGMLMNHVAFNGTDLWSSGTVMNMGSGGLTVNNLYTDGSFSNTALLTVNNNLYNSNNFTHTHQMVIGNDLWNGDTINGSATFTNDGIISVAHDFLNSETINGTGGKFCVQNYTANSGAISGTIDICDLTGGGIDANVGTVAGSVTFCATNCNIGVEENDGSSFNIYPNPFEQFISVETGSTELLKIELFDTQGRRVHSTNLYGKGVVSLPHLDNGMYFIIVSFANGKTIRQTLIK